MPNMRRLSFNISHVLACAATLPGLILFLCGPMLTSCNRTIQTGADREVTTLGTAEVSARLVEIPEPFPPNDLYNYAYILKYRVLKVHRGKVDGDEILVAQYNPLKPRSSVQDELSGKIGGDLKTFRAGDVHRMALEASVDEYWMGGVIDKYFNQTGVRYWAVWTNLESK
jgi:hypothetical protein